MLSGFLFCFNLRSKKHDEFVLTGKKWKYIMGLPNFKKEGKIMDRKELKSKIMKALTIALPILLVAILAMLIVVAMNLANENSVPVFNDGGITTSSNTNDADTPPDDSGNKNNGNQQEPVDDGTSQGLSFSSNGDGTCALDGIGSCKDTIIVVPEVSPDGDTVVEIAPNAFKNSNKIKGIELPESVESIGDYAFYGSTIRNVTIPTTVRDIGNYAFAGCKYLEEIEVEIGNFNYSSSSGVLYNDDGTVLITYPAGKTDNFVIITNKVTEIADMAFYKCTYVKKITYHGTSSAWQSIEIGSGNDVLSNATLYCAGDGGK